MQAQIHPKYYEEAEVLCACGNKFTVGSTMPKISVEVCSNCHPFYTGQMKFVDTAGRVDAFLAKKKMTSDKKVSKTEKRRLKREKKIQRELERPDTLAELRKENRAKKN